MTDDATIPDDANEPTRLLTLDAVREALGAINDETLASGDPNRIREAISTAVWRSRLDQVWREGLQGSALDSPAGRRVLSAARHAVAALPLDAIVRNVREARDADAAEQALARSLWRIDRDAAAELDRAVPDVFDAYRLPSGATWLVPRDPGGQPLFWNRRTQRFEVDPRMSRDRAIANLGQVLGSGFRKPAATFETIPQAEAWARSLPGEGDPFARALEEAKREEGDG